MRLSGVLLALLTVSVALAGCAAKTATPQSLPLTSAEVVALPTGGVRGTVVTEAQETIAGATVVARSASDQTVVAVGQSTEGGLFALDGIPMGGFELVASFAGYRDGVELVPIYPNEVTEPVFLMLTALEGDFAGYSINATRVNFGGLAWKATDPCQVAGTMRTCGVTNTPYGGGCNSPSPHTAGCVFAFGAAVTEDWATIVGEVQWRRNEEVPIGAIWLPRRGVSVYYDVMAPGTPTGDVGLYLDDPGRWWDATDKAPIRLRIDLQDAAGRGLTGEQLCCDWTWRVAAGWCDLGRCQSGGPDAGFSIDHIVTIFVATFHGEPAPAEFTMVDLTKQLECKPPRCGGD